MWRVKQEVNELYRIKLARIAVTEKTYWWHTDIGWLFKRIRFKNWKIVYYKNFKTIVLISYLIITYKYAITKRYFQIYNTDNRLVTSVPSWAKRNKWPAPSICISSAVSLNIICIMHTLTHVVYVQIFAMKRSHFFSWKTHMV